jgi:hypothetical protein
MSDDERKGLKLTPSAVEQGTYDEHIEGMQRGQSPQTRPTTPVSPINSINLSPEEKPPAEKAPNDAPPAAADPSTPSRGK